MRFFNRLLPRMGWLFCLGISAFSFECESRMAFGQQGTDGVSQRLHAQVPRYWELPDRTEELQRKIEASNGHLELDESYYRITRPLVLDLGKLKGASVEGSGGVRLIMDGPGPAFMIQGTHLGTASPKSFEPNTWNQHMPILEGVEILGASEQAIGIRLEGSVGAILRGVAVRWCQHGVHLMGRNRNVIISDCHFYENNAIGIFLDDVNLHQINVIGSHISYNQGGGIVVRDGNVRNLQVTGCDIEANMPFDQTATRAANIWIDVSGSNGDRGKSIAEIAITGCTIQHSANYSGDEDQTVAPGGANIRLSGKEIYPIDSVTISGNVISDTTCNIDLLHVMDVAIAANNFFAPKLQNIRVLHGNRVVLQGNTFNPRQFVRPGWISLTDCTDCVIANSTLHHLATHEGALRLLRCKGVVMNGLVVSECDSGVRIQDSENIMMVGCLFRGTKKGPDISLDHDCRQITLEANQTPSGIAGLGVSQISRE